MLDFALAEDIIFMNFYSLSMTFLGLAKKLLIRKENVRFESCREESSCPGNNYSPSRSSFFVGEQNTLSG
jgi:hypothetical protein